MSVRLRYRTLVEERDSWYGYAGALLEAGWWEGCLEPARLTIHRNRFATREPGFLGASDHGLPEYVYSRTTARELAVRAEAEERYVEWLRSLEP